ncbi:acyltransferase family protein [Nodosilinea sp. PGN35]|uniref:acyltransferase family protein n=1 Tax=Nodosilinea sp. PGN35 TaxID=3020489 RepID=UPI0023B2ED51|nr:acyltransferase family protein [Nodosilinea sp. TSF1-S3]MDF0367316.1 acyltransferase family protein [Nodosilinea sp. TSF1-S3]
MKISVNEKKLPTDFLRFFAIALIVNSHLEGFYPIPQLAADGFLGNSLFFALSGVGLALSKKNLQLSFTSWYARRVSRIYPALILVTLIFTITLELRWKISVIQFFRLIVWPTPFLFIAQLMIFYLFYYFIVKLNKKYLLAILLLLSLVFFSLYFYPAQSTVFNDLASYLHPNNFLSWVFYFQMMILGGWIAKDQVSSRSWVNSLSNNLFLTIFLVIFTFTAYALVKALMAFGFLSNGYFLLNLLTAGFLISVFAFTANSQFVGFLSSRVNIAKIVIFIASLTLEIYLVHVSFWKFKLFQDFYFPLNIALFVLLSIFAAFVLNQTVATVPNYIASLANRKEDC